MPTYTKPQHKLPPWLPKHGWGVTKPTNTNSPGYRGIGYLKYTSRSTSTGIPRGVRAHRYVVERLIHAELSMYAGNYSPIACHRRTILESMLLDGHLHPDIAVHHQDFDKLHCCGENLIAMHPSMNPAGPKRNPYTGQRITESEYAKIVGK